MNITTKVRDSIFRLSAICMLACSSYAIAAGDDPTTASIPDLDEIGLDTRRAIVIEAQVLTDGTTNLLDAVVSDVPPGAVDDDPPLLLLEALDASGAVLQSFNTWDPRWEYQFDEDGREEGVAVPDGEEPGLFNVPFDHRIATIRLHDQQLDPVQLLAIFDVAPLVEDFCTSNPDDPNCEGFVPSDQDSDGVANDDDNCPTLPNPGQEDQDIDGAGDACDPDDDGDNIDDTADNCPLLANASQVDSDSDGEGDVCDSDDDDDGVGDNGDICPLTSPGADVDADGCSAEQRDTDGDGVSDATDSCPATPSGAEVDLDGCQITSDGKICDVDLDNDVDRDDIWRIIFSPNRRNLDSGDPRDANGNGRVDFWDVVLCTRECDRNFCATR